MMYQILSRLTTLLIVLFPAIRVHAHPELVQQIDTLTSEIAHQPANGTLYLRRGELHRLHQDWQRAQADYDSAITWGADEPGIRLARGRLYYESGDTTRARQQLDSLANDHPEFSAVHLARARLLEGVGERLSAADAYSSAIAVAADPLPDWYLARANLLEGAGAQYSATAVRDLDDGMTRLGPLITFNLRAAELEERAGNTTEALARLTRIADAAQRKESYLVQLAELSARAGDAAGSKRFAEQANHAIDSLPPRLQNTSATLALRQRVRCLQNTPSIR